MIDGNAKWVMIRRWVCDMPTQIIMNFPFIHVVVDSLLLAAIRFWYTFSFLFLLSHRLVAFFLLYLAGGHFICWLYTLVAYRYFDFWSKFVFRDIQLNSLLNSFHLNWQVKLDSNEMECTEEKLVHIRTYYWDAIFSLESTRSADTRWFLFTYHVLH